MEGRRREGEQWRGGGGRDGGGREWCEVRSSLTWARRRLHPLMGAGRHCLGVHLCSHVVDSWAFVSIHPRSFSFTGVRFCWWASAFVGRRSSPFVRGWLHWWAFTFSVVVRLDPHGGS